MKNIFLLFVIFIASLPAYAQVSGGVKQHGAVVSGDCTSWFGNNQIQDAGSACGGGGGSVSITAGSTNLVVTPSPLTGTGTIDLSANPSVLSLTTTTFTSKGVNTLSALTTGYLQVSGTGVISSNNISPITSVPLGSGFTITQGSQNASPLTSTSTGLYNQTWPLAFTTSHLVGSSDLSSLDILNSTTSANFYLAATATGSAYNFLNINTGALNLTVTGAGPVFQGMVTASSQIQIPQYGFASCVFDGTNFDCAGAPILSPTLTSLIVTGTTALKGTTTIGSSSLTAPLNITSTGPTNIPLSYTGVNGLTFEIEQLSQGNGGDQIYSNFISATTSTDNWYAYRFGGSSNKWFFGDDGTNAYFQTDHKMYFEADGVNGGPLQSTTSAAFSIDSTGAISMPLIAQSSAAQTGTVCWTTGGNITYDASVGCLTSTKENKERVLQFKGGLAEVMKFKPISFYYKDKKMDANEELGLLAEDVKEVEPRLVGYGSDGKLRGVRYEQLTAVLISAIQDQQIEIDALKKQIGKHK